MPIDQAALDRAATQADLAAEACARAADRVAEAGQRPLRARLDVMDRIWEMTMPLPECGCYIFMGALGGRGYGNISIPTGRSPGKTCAVHKIAYEILVGPVPDGLELDHKCRVRSCWNPDHLEPVTPRVNKLRGVGITAKYARTTHCPQGHPYNDENTYRDPTGARECRICRREALARFHRKARPPFLPGARIISRRYPLFEAMTVTKCFQVAPGVWRVEWTVPGPLGCSPTTGSGPADRYAVQVDPRDPDPTREGIFRSHNCSRCRHGEKPCVRGNPRQCEWLHARND